MRNPYIPYPVRIDKITIENADRDLKTLKLVFLNKEDEESFQYLPGQFAELSVFGKGESPIGIASSPTEQGFLLFTVKRVGVLTSDLHDSEEGRIIGVRGPLGKPYPLDVMEGKNVVIVGGGFAFTTLRSTIRYILAPQNRSRFEKVTCIYGARSPGELMYKEELKEWEANPDIDMHITVDKGDESWTGREGFVPTVLKQVAPSADNAIALVCGPPIMLKFTFPVLLELDFAPEMIVVSLEMRMKCGIGKCGRCNIGNTYVCKDGPVYTYRQLQSLPAEY
ncbi:MAG: FAD/NAD(P)-binding protein [bacterium]|nr:FAD/NAD(P)-binding protein [bacterium]